MRKQKSTNVPVILGIIAVAVLLIVIVVSGIRDAANRTPGGSTTPTGPANLGLGFVVRPFSAMDLNGNAVDNGFFKGHRLTMVNVWGTYCGPCIREMPGLAQLPSEFTTTDFAILGIIVDTPDATNEATARQLVASAGATYTNLIPDASIQSNLLSDISVVPTTFFVDQNGKVVEKVLTGSRTQAEWRSIIEEIMTGLPAGT